jgi:glutamate/tyrosine decarboxylase-like PLP-dependent enzyme
MNMNVIDEPLLDLARDHAVRFLHSLPERHVGARATRSELLAALAGPLPRGGDAPAAVIEALAAAAERGAAASAGPRYFGFVIGGSLPVTLAAEWLAMAWDQNAGIFATSPIAAVVEEIAREWLLEVLDLPRDAGVGFVTGCQMANYTCLAAARHAVLRNAGWNVEEEGLPGAPAVNVVVSAEAHITILSSLRMLGFGTKRLLQVETDGQGRMRPEALERVLADLDGPLIVCTQAGNVNTGAIDPIGELARIAHAKGAWLHVDGAFGLWARACGDRRPLVEGVDDADSWATDAHKWLNVPYDSGLAIVRNSAAHRAAMTLTAAYLEQTTGVERDAIDWVPEFSRRARGIAIYAALRALGAAGVDDLIDRSCQRARQMAELLGRDPRVQILNEVVLNQVLVRFGDDDELTRAVISRVQREGTCWLGGTTWHGLAAMRISFSHWATSEEDVERSAAAILGCIGA